ncbi:hypothetical protein PICMEDRAFT_13659 [Pichia membranifaciens NRRL Y-2026]|uniref:Uncharacterized protein n=1 Tax=Pichia membranifaciens NRRL Y-2026 TaxID=763406 RepID=A0A1E3NEB4_9ASCO|nr:hypothetical protein PICMEDRAFT_13659 [Pichia membranifaciens NRRL Y-2026]ODQ44462.1 hypothetical protein PICMEDRAFT_13659 [Pichia membranifaciens NRRL Y-2026]
MSTLDEVRNEIRELELEIEELEQEGGEDESFDGEPHNDDISNYATLDQLGKMDELLYDILNDKNDDLDMGEIVDGRRILRSKELQALHGDEIPKIQIENVYRFNGITMFPISNDPERIFIGIRFDVFNSYLKKFTTCHYIILKQLDIEASEKEQQLQISPETKAGNFNWRWEVFQTTVPKHVPIGDVARDYLSVEHTREPASDAAPVPSFNRMNKFAMHIYEHLSLLEERKAFAYKLQGQYASTKRVLVKFDPAVCRIEITLFDKKRLTTTKLVVDSDSTATRFFLNVKGSGGAENESRNVAHTYWSSACGAVNVLPDMRSFAVAVQKSIDTFLLQY